MDLSKIILIEFIGYDVRKITGGCLTCMHVLMGIPIRSAYLQIHVWKKNAKMLHTFFCT